MRDINIKYLFCSARHRGVHCPMHLHDTMEIVLVTDGILCMKIGGKTWSIPAGSGVFIQPFETHSFRSEQPNTCHVLMFSGEIVTFFWKHCKSHMPGTPFFTPAPENLSRVDALLPADFNEADPIRVQAVLAPLCGDIADQCCFTPRALLPQDAMAQALEYIHAHFTEPITATQVAQAVGLHPVTLSKGFCATVGFYFNDYVNHLRCSHGAMLLKSSDITAAEVAFATGFGSIRSFNRAFLRVYGITPTRYRNSSII